MHLAVGTSFAIIIPTSIVSVLTHHKFNAVDFNVVKSYGIFVVEELFWEQYLLQLLKQNL